MKLTRGKFFLVGLVFYFIFLIVQAPAYVLNQFLSQATQNQIVLEKPTGTVWRGSASRLVIQAPLGARIPFDVVHWKLLPLSLLRGELALNLSIANARYPARGTFAFAKQRIHVKNLQAQLPPAALLAFAPQFNIWQPGGQFSVKADDFLLTQTEIKGAAEILWVNATLNLVKIQPVGTYKLTVLGTSQGADVSLNTLAGPLDIQGTGQWSQNQRLRFSGVAKARSHGEQLAPLLKIMGQEEGNGLYKIAIK